MKKKQNLLNNGLKNNEKKVDFNLLFITATGMLSLRKISNNLKKRTNEKFSKKHI